MTIGKLRLSGALSVLLILGEGLAMAQEGNLDNRDAVVHVLNRITFGPRQGDVEMVQKMGLHNYIEQQLHPETIDDSIAEQDVSKFAFLQMSPAELTAMVKEGKAAKKEKKAAAREAEQPTAPGTSAAPTATPMTKPVKPEVKNGKAEADAVIEELGEAKLVRAVESQRQLQEVLADFWNNHFNIDVKKKLCGIYKVSDDRDTIRPHIWGKFRNLLEASAKSPAMLYYLDNFRNTVAKSSPDKESMQEKNAPMSPNGTVAAQPPKKAKSKKEGGINENYAREVMELHTLGVDGGYTQQDVQEVARCFTGWSIGKKTGQFIFNAAEHDNGSKTVLGHAIPANGGMQDGETVLDILASSPACAHHISLELCQRFVSDTPPEALVQRIAGVFTQTGGDLRQVTEAILTSPEFLSPASYGNKVKSPLEFTVSAVRASGSTIIARASGKKEEKIDEMEGKAVRGKQNASERLDKSPMQPLSWHVVELGEPLFACTPPTGYKEVSSSWVSPGGLIERLNFALALTQHKISDVVFDAQKVLKGTDLDKPNAILNQCVALFLQNQISDSTRQVLERSALPASGTSQTVDPSKLIALLIGSPEFQKK